MSNYEKLVLILNACGLLLQITVIIVAIFGVQIRNWFYYRSLLLKYKKKYYNIKNCNSFYVEEKFLYHTGLSDRDKDAFDNLEKNGWIKDVKIDWTNEYGINYLLIRFFFTKKFETQAK